MHALVLQVARVMAFVGGAVLSVLILLTCVSILGRSLNGVLHSDAVQSVAPALAKALLAAGIGPVDGDFEIVESGMAFAIFAFLPLCQMTGSHATVDVFTSGMSAKVNRWLRWVAEILFALVLIVIAVQLFGGMQSKLRSGQTTLLLEYPVWWSYALSVVGAVTAALVAVYVAAMRTVEVTTGRNILPIEEGAEH